MSVGRELWIKICGVTNPEDAELAVEAGASALGLNFVPASRRFITVDEARRIVDAVRGRIELVGVFADETRERLLEVDAELGLDWLQLHGHEDGELVATLPRAFKAVGVSDASDVARAASYRGERLLVDAKAQGALGGTGQRFDWALVRGLARERPLIVAGGLTPDNVGDAVQSVRPYGVDVASGVEQSGEPRRKDADAVRRFVDNARRAR